MRYPRLAAALAVTGSMFLSAQLQADTYLSIGSNPVGNTAYQWAAGISEVVNKNVGGVNAAAEGTKGYVANVQLMLDGKVEACLLYTSPSPRDVEESRMPSSA